MMDRISRMGCTAILFAMAILMISNDGCATFDNYRVNRCGSIIDVAEGEITFIVGCKERVRLGQILNVCARIKAHPGFTRQYKHITMGMVQITEFIDERTARAKILHGVIIKGYRVQL
jgi:hypothetical protein